MGWMFIDTTLIRAHSDTVGQKGGKKTKAHGHSRGGFGTKIHVTVEGLGNPVEFRLSGGQVSDIIQSTQLIDGHRPEIHIADKAYNSDDFVKTIESKGVKVVCSEKEPSSDKTERNNLAFVYLSAVMTLLR